MNVYLAAMSPCEECGGLSAIDDLGVTHWFHKEDCPFMDRLDAFICAKKDEEE